MHLHVSHILCRRPPTVTQPNCNKSLHAKGGLLYTLDSAACMKHRARIARPLGQFLFVYAALRQTAGGLQRSPFSRANHHNLVSPLPKCPTNAVSVTGTLHLIIIFALVASSFQGDMHRYNCINPFATIATIANNHSRIAPSTQPRVVYA